MKFVLRALKKNVSSKTKKINGIIHYEFPIVSKDKEGNEKTYHVYIPKTKTYISGIDTICVCLDSESVLGDNYLKENLQSTVSDKQLLKILSNDYIAYMASSNYNPALPHAMNTFIPIGVQEYNGELNETHLNKWHDACKTILNIYGEELTCIEPFTCNSLYPFHYQKFINGEFIREYRSNVIMFVLCMDKNFVLTDEKKFDNNSYIYYKLKDRYYPFFRMITNEQFYESCLVKDVKNFKKTPFLKSFNDQGLCKEVIAFMREDEVYKSTVVSKYKEIRDEMKLSSKDKERYFIPSLKNEAIDVLRKMKTGQKVTADEKELYKKACQERIEYISEYYFDKHKRFFFTYDEISDETITINSATKDFVDNSGKYIGYDASGRIIYSYDDENARGVTPLLEAITKDELDILKDEVYNYWISHRYYKR